MENRRLQGRAMIERKLKFGQEFLMSNNLSSNAPVWTRWHEERVVNKEMDKDLTFAPNKKYINVSLIIHKKAIISF